MAWTATVADLIVMCERYNYKCDTKQNKRLESMVKRKDKAERRLSLTREGLRIADYNWT